MDAKFGVGLNRFSTNSYYVYETKDILQTILQYNRSAYPALNTDLLFLSGYGIMEIVTLLDIDKTNQKLTIQYKGESFRFDVDTDQIVTKWQKVSQLTPELLPYYKNNESYQLKEAVMQLDKALDFFKVIKDKHLKKIDSDLQLLEAEKMLIALHNKIEMMLNNNDFNM